METNNKDIIIKPNGSLGLTTSNYPHNKLQINMDNKQLWWGYKHKSGTYQAKRYFDPLDILEAHESPFCEKAVGPFYAVDRDEALKKVQELISNKGLEGE